MNVGISQVLAIGLQGQGWPWWGAVIAVLLMGAVVGLANGILTTRVRIDSFIATLGTGTILYGLNAWYTGGQQVLATLPPAFLAISGSVWIVPAPAIYALAVSLTLWVVFEYLPLGRYLYVLGASPRAAELNGISAKRYITLAFVAAGMLASFAGVVLQSQLQVGQSSVGQEYLLPAFTAALLGATSIRPGRVNVWPFCNSRGWFSSGQWAIRQTTNSGGLDPKVSRIKSSISGGQPNHNLIFSLEATPVGEGRSPSQNSWTSLRTSRSRGEFSAAVEALMSSPR